MLGMTLKNKSLVALNKCPRSARGQTEDSQRSALSCGKKGMHSEAEIHMTPSHTGLALVINRPIKR